MMTQKKPFKMTQVTCVDEDELRKFTLQTKSTNPAWELECNEWVTANKEQLSELYLYANLMGDTKTSLKEWLKIAWFSWKCNYRLLDVLQSEVAIVMK